MSTPLIVEQGDWVLLKPLSTAIFASKPYLVKEVSGTRIYLVRVRDDEPESLWDKAVKHKNSVLVVFKNRVEAEYASKRLSIIAQQRMDEIAALETRYKELVDGILNGTA